MTSIPILDKNIHQTMSWIYSIEEECNWEEEENHRRTFGVLRVVLHVLRDLLPLENAIHLSAQLPLILRGLFFENWSTHSDTPRIRKKQDFLAAVTSGISPNLDIDIESVTKCILRVLGDKVSAGELDKIIKVIPEDIRDLFN